MDALFEKKEKIIEVKEHRKQIQKKEDRVKQKRIRYEMLMKAFMYISTWMTGALVFFLLSYVLVKGIPNLSMEFLTTKPSYITEKIGILPDILNTVYIVLATLFIVLPLGVGAAIYLTEYASNKKVVNAIEYAAETLSGIPSIIYGLVGILLSVYGNEDLSFGRGIDLGNYESSNHYENNTGKFKNSSSKL